MNKLLAVFALHILLSGFMPAERAYSAQLPLVINEFMASNSSSAQDPQGQYDDWIEIYNFGTDAIDLDGMHLTDNLSVPDKWRTHSDTRGATIIPPGGFLVIWADNDTADPYLAKLERELLSTREYLQSTNEELETSNEELKSTNEELQSVNEELQSTNEELETSKEELQSTNEELVTVNAELLKKVDELSEVNNDINNLLASTEIGTIFLDINLCIRRFTPPVIKIFNLIHTDIGRPIIDITAKIQIDDLYDRAKEVLHTLARQELEVQDKNGVWYSMRLMPYRTLENVIDGVVINFVDVSKLKEIKQLTRLVTVIRDSNDTVTVQDLDGNILAWNKGAMQMYGWSEAEALKMNVRELVPQNKRKELTTLTKRIKNKEHVAPFATQRLCKNGKLFNVWLTITALEDEGGKPVEIATTERDLTELKKIRTQSIR